MKANQLSRYGAISKVLPLMSPGAKVHFVGSTSASWYGDFLTVFGPDEDGGNRVFPTIAAAISDANVVAARGDVIMILPGYTDTISSSTSLTLSKSGIRIVGMGHGSTRPTITFTTATSARINVTAADIRIENCIFVANFADIATAFLLTTAPGFGIINCEFRDTSSILNFVALVTTTVSVNSDGFIFSGNRVSMLGTTAATTPIKILNTIDRVLITGNFVVKAVLNNTSCLLAHGALVVTNLEMSGNVIFSANTDSATGAFLITTSATTNTGMVYNNYVKGLDVAAEVLVTSGSAYGLFNNLYNGDANASGFVSPAIGSTS